MSRGDNDQDNHFLTRSAQHLQANLRRSGLAMMAGYTLIGSILLLGGLGYLIDQWRDTFPGFFLGGLILGLIVGFYELAKTVFKP